MTTFYIVTPSYNQAQFLKQTVDSILLHKEKFVIKYIVMDGGSTDDSVKLLRSYGRKVVWQSEKDAGQTDAINKGIRYFAQLPLKDKADCIFAYLNSDDYYLPETLAKVAHAFVNQPDKQWIVGDAKIVDSSGSEIQRPIRWYKQFWRTVYGNWVLNILNPIPQPSVFIRWTAVQEIGLFTQSLRYVMDYEYCHRLQKKFGNQIILNTPLSAFRIHGQSKGGTAFIKQFAEELDVVQKYCQNRLLITLHQLHTACIVGVYRLIK
jgi:glycosyltransferase involved in cell wall biosynthesis